MGLVEDKMLRFKGECAYFSFNKCPIWTHYGASAKFSTNSHEIDYSVGTGKSLTFIYSVPEYSLKEYI